VLILAVMMAGLSFGDLQAQDDDDMTPLVIDREAIEQSTLVAQGYPADDVAERLESTWDQLFYGSDDFERIYYPVEDDMAYMLDVANSDVRSEGMSYGMMIAVQLDRQAEFDALWKWAKTYMYHPDGGWMGYFAWHCRTDGRPIDLNPAPDGEEWFAMALFFASARWGDGEGIFNYRREANMILEAMLLDNDERPGSLSTAMFDAEYHMIVFVPQSNQYGDFTDPSYHLPHFYELWGDWADTNNDYWYEAARVSREFWQTTAHPETGLMPNYAEFTGEPRPTGNIDRGTDYGGVFYADAWRNGMTVAMDYLWSEVEGDWHVQQSNRLLEFFYGLGINSYNSQFLIDGTPVQNQHRSAGLIAMNAIAASIATTDVAPEFIDAFWREQVPNGQWRYYDGLLHMFALLHLSGNFTVYNPDA
jgi:oligosaccharide reducing-end xylanase